MKANSVTSGKYRDLYFINDDKDLTRGRLRFSLIISFIASGIALAALRGSYGFQELLFFIFIITGYTWAVMFISSSITESNAKECDKYEKNMSNIRRKLESFDENQAQLFKDHIEDQWTRQSKRVAVSIWSEKSEGEIASCLEELAKHKSNE